MFLSNTLPLYCHAVPSGLVIDCGYLMNEVSATIQSTFTKIGSKTSIYGSAKIDQEIYKHLCEDNELDPND